MVFPDIYIQVPISYLIIYKHHNLYFSIILYDFINTILHVVKNMTYRKVLFRMLLFTGQTDTIRIF